MKKIILTGIFIPGGPEAVEKALAACASQNGGVMVGNPTVEKYMTSVHMKDGTLISVILVERDADREEWWQEYARVHGYRFQEHNPTAIPRPADDIDS